MNLFLILLLVPLSAVAHPILELQSAGGAAGDPWVSLSLRTDCPPMDRFDIAASELSLREKGKEIPRYEIVQCQGDLRQQISVALGANGGSVLYDALHLVLTVDTAIAEDHVHLSCGIVDPLAGRQRGPITFTLQYDTTLLSFPYLSMPINSLISYDDIRIEPVAGGVRITAGNDQPGREWHEGSAPLLAMIFRAHAPTGRGDTIPYAIAVTDAAFTDGSSDLVIDEPRGTIFAHGPKLGFTGEHPWEAHIDRMSGEWNPSEFLIKVRLFNWGDRPAQEISGRLDIDTTKLFFISPISGEYYHPGGILAANDFVEIVWKVGVRGDIIPPDSATSCMTMYGAGGWAAQCCCRIHFRESPLSVDELPTAGTPSLTLWPNPGAGQVRVTIPEDARQDGVLAIYDALGRTIMMRDVPNGRGEAALDLTGLPQGVYILRLAAAGHSRSARYLLVR